jgi:predicted acylesterase/phospholipase RssA
MSSDDRSVGVALSGGGHRATAWALGALLYLVDVGASKRVRSIASVSGGSIANGVVARGGQYSTIDRNAFVREIVAPLARRLSIEGTIFAHAEARSIRPIVTCMGTVAGSLMLIGSFLAGAPVVDCAWSHPVLTAYVFTAAVVAAGLALTMLFLRGPIFRAAYDKILFKGQTLASLPTDIEHVFCATDLQFGEHVYLSKRFLYSYRQGVGEPRDTLLADAVAASASFPGAFPPIVLSRSSHAFEAGAADPPPKRLVLLDGGIYDNMADQWFAGTTKRLSGEDGDANSEARANRLRNVVALKENPHELIVVNASPAFERKEIEHAWWPWSEIQLLVRMIFALDDNATSLRRQMLISSTTPGSERDSRTLVHIGTNPEATVRFVERSTRTSAEKKQRAATARRLLTTLGTNIGASKWADLVDRNKDVDTVLDPLGTACIADLVQHAYVLSAVQCHVFLGYPLPPEREWESLFGRARFDAIARGNVATS